MFTEMNQNMSGGLLGRQEIPETTWTRGHMGHGKRKHLDTWTHTKTPEIHQKSLKKTMLLKMDQNTNGNEGIRNHQGCDLPPRDFKKK